jgi:hypothetical protein
MFMGDQQAIITQILFRQRQKPRCGKLDELDRAGRRPVTN